MVQRELVTSGFDTETLVSERYVSYLLLAQIEAGLFGMQFSVEDATQEIDIDVTLHPPSDYERLYVPDPTAPLPTPDSRSFDVELLPDEASPPASLCFRPDDGRLAAASWDGRVRVWDVEGRKELIVTDERPSAAGLSYSPDGTLLAVAYFDGHVRIIDAETGVDLVDIDAHQSGPALGVEFHPDGDRFASFGADGVIRLWDTASGDEVAELTGHGGPVLAAAFNGDGTQLISGSIDGSARLWDVAGAVELATLVDGDVAVSAADFRADGAQVAVGFDNGATRLVDPTDGSIVATLVGHTAGITAIHYHLAGTRVATGSLDRTARTWSTSDGGQLTIFRGHRKPVLSVAFPSDGTQVASGSEDGTIRMWHAITSVQLAAYRVPFLAITVFVSVTNNATGQSFPPLPATLVIAFEIEADETNAGLERNHSVRLSFLRLAEQTAEILTGFGVDVGAVERELRSQFNRAIPLGVAQGQQVQQVRMRKFVTDEHRSLGFYVNLALRSDPEPDSYVPPRGDLSLAQDFRSDDSPLAFATSQGLYALLGPDFKFRQAEETFPGSGTYRYPLREDPSDTEGDPIGRIKGVQVGPRLTHLGGGTFIPTGALLIDIHGEYTDAPGDPDFHVELTLDSKVDGEGLVEWDIDVDVDVGLLATLVLLVGGIIVSLFIPGGIAWGSRIIIGALIGVLLLKELIAEPLAARIIAEHVDKEAQASFVDAIPLRVPAATRRWDPFYNTVHEVVALVNEVAVDTVGISFESIDVRLGKRPQPVTHVVARDEERDVAGSVSGLRYRVFDFTNLNTLDAAAPGVDRRPFDRLDPVSDPTLVSLTNAEIADRIADGRLVAPISYHAKMIHVVGNQIDALMCISTVERNEQRASVIREFRSQSAVEIAQDQGDDIRDTVSTDLESQLGRPPTTGEVDDEVERRIGSLVDEAQIDFEANELRDELEAAIARVLRFDLAPEEMVTLQRAGVLALQDVVIIKRHNDDGSVTDYYRDYADADTGDNLLSLPHYTPPYESPD